MKDKFNIGISRKNLLTRPNSDFLAKLSELTRSTLTDEEWFEIHKTRFAVNIIENNIIQGQIMVSDMPSLWIRICTKIRNMSVSDRKGRGEILLVM